MIEILNTIAKVSLILSDIIYHEHRNSEMSLDIRMFEQCIYEDFTCFAWFSIYQDFDKFNPMDKIEYIYYSNDERIEIKFIDPKDHYSERSILLMKYSDIDFLLDKLKNEYPKLYDIVWLKYTDKKYDKEFAWEIL